jgi:hypothetical protein
LVELQLRVEESPLLMLPGLAPSDTVGAGGFTVTVVLAWAVPPAPLQSSVKLVVAVKAPVDCVPLVGCAPLQPPEAVQLVALLVLQPSVVAAPLLIVPGLADSVTAGAGVFTVTVVLASELPPAPLQLSVYTVVAVSVPVDCEPLTGCPPLQPPDAVQFVASLEFQLNVELLPVVMLAGLDVKLTVGGVVTVTAALSCALPPAPLQLSV